MVEIAFTPLDVGVTLIPSPPISRMLDLLPDAPCPCLDRAGASIGVDADTDTVDKGGLGNTNAPTPALAPALEGGDGAGRGFSNAS